MEEVKNTQQEAKQETKLSTFSKLRKAGFVIFNLLYIIAYSVYTAITLTTKNQQIEWLPYALGAFIAVYLVLFISMLATGRGDRRVKNDVKNYKSSFKIIKKLLKLANLFLTIAMVVNAVVNDRDSLFALILACVSVPFVLLQIILEIRKIIKRHKMLKIKEEKEACDKKFIGDVKEIIKGKSVAVATEQTTQEAAATTEPVPKISVEENAVATQPKKTKGLNAVAQKIKSDEITQKAKQIASRTKEYYNERKSIGKKPEKKKETGSGKTDKK